MSILVISVSYLVILNMICSQFLIFIINYVTFEDEISIFGWNFKADNN